MARLRSRLLRTLLVLVVVLVVGAAGGALWLRGQLAGSLPLLDGEHVLAGLAAPVRVERDALGIPSITAASAEDAARAGVPPRAGTLLPDGSAAPAARRRAGGP
ncbi:MAG: hypothetical protein Q8L86_00370, partial [Vicinamibacterales bacterium]|nr:hypothetical protein [Vicinamibacterales bacterium]